MARLLALTDLSPRVAWLLPDLRYIKYVTVKYDFASPNKPFRMKVTVFESSNISDRIFLACLFFIDICCHHTFYKKNLTIL